jgi:hypothetical protein
MNSYVSLTGDSFTFEELLGQPYRAFLFVNGWMRVANHRLVLFIYILVAFLIELGIRPQAKFPVHERHVGLSGRDVGFIRIHAF